MKRDYPMALKNEIVLSGGDVANARVAWDQNQLPYVALEFKSRGAQVFCDITTANVGKQFAIVLDDQVRSAPNIKQRICGGAASIEMGSDANALDEANTLALVLRSGSLTAPVSIAEVRTVGPSLGADAIAAGKLGTLIGGVMVMLYMALWYKRSGMIANGALVLNVTLVFAWMGIFGATLTLPGIAGIALTIGMAVDANIIVFERIREELRLGVIARRAVDAGYDRAAVAIIDSNLTTALAGVVLYSYGTGPIRGFAVTLLVGIVTTLVTALFVTRTFMDIMTRDSSARLDL
jgi:preprotein translocase subunit SecD